MSTATLESRSSLEEPRPDSEDPDYWLVEHEASSYDPSYLIDRYARIDRPKSTAAGDGPEEDLAEEDQGKPAGPVRFRLWPAQVGLLGTIATERLTVILKARQLGISWLVCAYVLWLCLFNSGQVVLLISKGQKESNELIRRIKVMFERLPEGLKRLLPGIVPPNSVRTITWTNGSRIEAMPATKNAGISYTASLVVMDEAAHMLHGAALYDAIKPTMEAGGQLIMLSTANGIGGFFHSVWEKAVARRNAIKAIFLPWWARPGRDWAWYQRIRSEAHDPDLVPQEYPSNAIEAFRASGRMRFKHDWIVRQTENLRDPIPESRLPDQLRSIPGLRLYKPALPGRKYVLAADVAEGLETSDYDAGTVLDRETWEEVALLHGQWEPDLFAVWMMALGRYFNDAFIIPERNNHGHSAISTMRLKGYPNIGEGLDGRHGWLTGSQGSAAKTLGIDLVAEALRQGLMTVRSLAALNEFQTFYRLANLKLGASPGNYDDIVMSWSIGLSWLRHQMSQPQAEEPSLGGEAPRPSGFLPAPNRGMVMPGAANGGWGQY